MHRDAPALDHLAGVLSSGRSSRLFRAVRDRKLASSIGAYANLVLLVMIARHRFGVLGVRSIAASLGRTVAASIGLAVWCALLLLRWPAAASRSVEAAWLAAAIIGGALAFWLASGALAASERDALAAILPSRRSR